MCIFLLLQPIELFEVEEIFCAFFSFFNPLSFGAQNVDLGPVLFQSFQLERESFWCKSWAFGQPRAAFLVAFLRRFSRLWPQGNNCSYLPASKGNSLSFKLQIRITVNNHQFRDLSFWQQTGILRESYSFLTGCSFCQREEFLLNQYKTYLLQ